LHTPGESGHLLGQKSLNIRAESLLYCEADIPRTSYETSLPQMLALFKTGDIQLREWIGSVRVKLLEAGSTAIQPACMTKSCPFRYFKTSPEIIHQAVMMYAPVPLSLRDVEGEAVFIDERKSKVEMAP